MLHVSRTWENGMQFNILYSRAHEPRLHNWLFIADFLVQNFTRAIVSSGFLQLCRRFELLHYFYCSSYNIQYYFSDSRMGCNLILSLHGTRRIPPLATVPPRDIARWFSISNRMKAPKLGNWNFIVCGQIAYWRSLPAMRELRDTRCKRRVPGAAATLLR